MELNFSLVFSGILFFFFIWLFEHYLQNFFKDYDCKKIDCDCSNCKHFDCVRYCYLYDREGGKSGKSRF